jgi:hypothetical protein|eukprot:COSAG01_NODE_26461_length_713_cov_1.410423_1_plen_127_part_00
MLVLHIVHTGLQNRLLDFHAIQAEKLRLEERRHYHCDRNQSDPQTVAGEIGSFREAALTGMSTTLQHIPALLCFTELDHRQLTMLHVLTQGEQESSIAGKVFIAQVFNTGVLLLIMNADLGHENLR